MSWFFVFLGGGLGSLSRYGISRIWLINPSGFPWPTLVANVCSCIILGFLMTFLLRDQQNARHFLMIGFCGGFSTFSTFTAEVYQQWAEGNWISATLIIAANLFTCLLGLAIGLKLAGLTQH